MKEGSELSIAIQQHSGSFKAQLVEDLEKVNWDILTGRTHRDFKTNWGK